MKHRFVIPVLLAMAVACNTAPEKKQEDSTIVDGAKTLVPVAPPPPASPNPYEAEINAPDTLFEDGSIPGSWENAGFNDPEGFKRFLISFKNWVKMDQVDSIAAHIRFPLKNYKTAEVFRQQYKNIFDTSLKTVVEKQRLNRVFRNDQGAMLGNGEIWFNVFPEGYKIIAINK